MRSTGEYDDPSAPIQDEGAARQVRFLVRGLQMLDGTSQQVTVLFLDIRGYSSLAERLEAETAAQIFDELSRFGIDDGRVSRLVISKTGEWKGLSGSLYNFDRGLDFDETPAGLRIGRDGCERLVYLVSNAGGHLPEHTHPRDVSHPFTELLLCFAESFSCGQTFNDSPHPFGNGVQKPSLFPGERTFVPFRPFLRIGDLNGSGLLAVGHNVRALGESLLPA